MGDTIATETNAESGAVVSSEKPRARLDELIDSPIDPYFIPKDVLGEGFVTEILKDACDPERKKGSGGYVNNTLFIYGWKYLTEQDRLKQDLNARKMEWEIQRQTGAVGIKEPKIGQNKIVLEHKDRLHIIKHNWFFKQLPVADGKSIKVIYAKDGDFEKQVIPLYDIERTLFEAHVASGHQSRDGVFEKVKNMYEGT